MRQMAQGTIFLHSKLPRLMEASPMAMRGAPDAVVTPRNASRRLMCRPQPAAGLRAGACTRGDTETAMRLRAAVHQLQAS